MMVLVFEGVLGGGIVVWVCFFKENFMYYKGFILYKGIKLYVDFYRGEKFIYEFRDVLCMVIFEIFLKVVEIKFGIRVIVKYKDKFLYYIFIVIEVDGF